MGSDFTISITTFNRLNELKKTLHSLETYSYAGARTIICDDGSTDGTSEFIRSQYPEILLLRNSNNRGLIFSRNRIMENVTTPYAISLDDDAHFLSKHVLQKAKEYFIQHSRCGVIACRIYWGLKSPANSYTGERNQRVQSFVGCGHIWRMAAWRDIPNYPEWFIFYGEEEFASFHLFKRSWEIHYVPAILVQHRVEVKVRKVEKDYWLRLRRSLRSGWYLYLLFYPWREIPKRFIYTLWIQLKLKAFKGDRKALRAIFFALMDTITNSSKLMKQNYRLTPAEFKKFEELPETKIYYLSKDFNE